MISKINNTFYRDTIIAPIAVRLSIYARNKMLELFYKEFPPLKGIKILDLGVTSDTDTPSNLLEKTYPYLENITCAGIQDCSEIQQYYPGVKVVQLHRGGKLPFNDLEFDIVYSNAVLEHVGSRSEQQKFIDEVQRVGKNFFITTPNRWFPVEHHTHLPFLHYLPQKYFRKFLRIKGEVFFSKEENLNLCSESDLKKFKYMYENIAFEHIRLFGFSSNLCIFNKNKSINKK